MQRIIITEKPANWELEIENVQAITPHDYIHDIAFKGLKRARVVNLCKSYQYQSEGYYISLLAEARGHKVIPVTSTLIDLKLPSLARDDAEDFDNMIQVILDKARFENRVKFNVYFGQTEETALHRVGALFFNLFQTPIQEVVFIKKEKWHLQSLKPLNLKDLKTGEREIMMQALGNYLAGKKIQSKNYTRRKYDLAILVMPGDLHPPSNARAIQKFTKAAENVGFNVEFITKNDYSKITDYDALFIRETTNVNHHTFRFARKAEYEGLAVLDDPSSILKCTNKVYLEELLSSNKVPTPKSLILRKSDHARTDELQYPLVIKLPDGSFSRGVKKIENTEQLNHWLKEYFQHSDLIILQEFMPTEFDWRVGVLNGQVLFVCKYFMARNHWQIIEWRPDNKHREGAGETVDPAQAPKGLIRIALKASALIGKGLYGVDVKEHKGKFYVIEVNDNPNIDAGVEDKVGNMKVYETIMKHLLNEVLSNEE